MPRPLLRLTALLPVLLVAACAYGNDPAPPPRSTALPPPSPTAAATAAPAPPASLAAPVPRTAAAAPRGPQPVPVPARGAAQGAGPSPATISACRAEAERAAVTRNRGDLMRLEGRDVDLGDSNRVFDEQVRGFAQQDRDRLFRECLSRADSGSTRIP
jgi:hypothetical protein